MRIGQACKVIAQGRGDRVIVATMGAMFALDALGVAERRLSSVPLMGGAASLALGLSLARPDIGTIVIDGDASLLMQLGGLVSVADNRPQRLLHFVVHNGTQFTGASNLAVPGGQDVDFCAMASAAGYRGAHRFDSLEALTDAMPALLQEAGPTFVTLVVEPETSQFGSERPQPEMPDRQFARMGIEAEHLAGWYAETVPEHAQ
ncbi:MAG: thiamine pyrophosphate-binding protein [Proteobacteria bacterium]|nr:thiamine pyrophosphate-binding protein [Pseudomonadota bacterium]